MTRTLPKEAAHIAAVATVALLKEGRIHATIIQREHEMGYRCVQILSQRIASGVEATLAIRPAARFVETDII